MQPTTITVTPGQPVAPPKEVPAIGPRKVVVWVARAISYLVYLYLIAVEIILALGFFLLLFGANPDSGFTQWVYRNLDRAMAPFRGIFTPINLGTVGGDIPSVFETSVLFAMIVYGIVAIAFSALINWLTHRMHYLEDAEERQRQWAEYQANLQAYEAQQAQQAFADAQARAAQAASVQTVAGQTVPGQAAPGVGQSPQVPPPPPAS